MRCGSRDTHRSHCGIGHQFWAGAKNIVNDNTSLRLFENWICLQWLVRTMLL